VILVIQLALVGHAHQLILVLKLPLHVEAVKPHAKAVPNHKPVEILATKLVAELISSDEYSKLYNCYSTKNIYEKLYQNISYFDNGFS
jgi:hypothetical protein